MEAPDLEGCTKYGSHPNQSTKKRNTARECYTSSERSGSAVFKTNDAIGDEKFVSGTSN
jgi:hypothetical protein